MGWLFFLEEAGAKNLGCQRVDSGVAELPVLVMVVVAVVARVVMEVLEAILVVKAGVLLMPTRMA